MKFGLKFLRGPRRTAASEALGAILTVGMTLAMGAAAWGYVNTQSGVSETAYASKVGSSNNYLNEQFKIVDMYFGSSTSTTLWAYNTGSLGLQFFKARLYDSAGLVNILYNYTVSGQTKTDYLFDLRSTLATKCKTAASSYESPTLSSMIVKTTNAQTLQFTIPPTQANCPSFGQTFTSGTTYVVVVTGLMGNTVTYYQAK